MNRIYIGFIALILCMTISCQNRQRQLSPEEMQEDIHFYFSELKRVHPMLDRFYPMRVIDSVENDLYAKCKHPLTVNRFAFYMMQTKFFQDEHTCCYFNIDAFQKNVLGEDSSKKLKLLPLVEIKNDKLFLFDEEIKSVNGHEVDEDLAELRKMTSASNHPAYNDQVMSNLYSYYLLDKCGPCEEYRLVTSKGTTITCNSLKDLSDYSYDFRAKYHLLGAQKVYFEHFPEDSLSVFHFNSCLLDEGDATKIKKEFEYISSHDIKYLIIDVSKNGGGNDGFCLQIINNYLVHDEYSTVVRQIVKPEIWNEFTKGQNSVGTLISPEDNILADRGLKMREINLHFNENKTGFDGELYIIQGPNTYSAAISFCTWTRMLHLGKSVGQPVGHEYIYAGNVMGFVLPNSKLPFRSATTIHLDEYANYDFDRFLTPDILLDEFEVNNIDSYKKIIKMNHDKP